MGSTCADWIVRQSVSAHTYIWHPFPPRNPSSNPKSRKWWLTGGCLALSLRHICSACFFKEISRTMLSAMSGIKFRVLCSDNLVRSSLAHRDETMMPLLAFAMGWNRFWLPVLDIRIFSYSLLINHEFTTEGHIGGANGVKQESITLFVWQGERSSVASPQQALAKAPFKFSPRGALGHAWQKEPDWSGHAHTELDMVQKQQQYGSIQSSYLQGP